MMIYIKTTCVERQNKSETLSMKMFEESKNIYINIYLNFI